VYLHLPLPDHPELPAAIRVALGSCNSAELFADEEAVCRRGCRVEPFAEETVCRRGERRVREPRRYPRTAI
jgi:hypothetical protein